MSSSGSPTRILFDSDTLRIGRFDCSPEEPLWDLDLAIGGDHVVFPRSPVHIVQHGRDGFLATSNHVVFYGAGQEYRRSRFESSGDHCLFVEFQDDTLVAAAADLQGRHSSRLNLPFSHGPLSARVHLAHLALERALAAPVIPSRVLGIEELAIELARVALAGASGRRSGSTRRPRSLRARTALVEAAKEELAAAGPPPTLSELASRVHSSPHHLAHVFRQATGFTLHGYARQLRLRAAARTVTRGRLAEAAVSTGFRSHGHFSRQFTKTFSTTPSRVATDRDGAEWVDLAAECLAPG